MKIVTKDIPIYFGYFRIVICKDFNKGCKKIKKEFPEYKLDTFDAFVFPDRTKKNISRYTVFLKPKASPSIIAHETVHLVNAMFINSHIQLDRHNDEHQAYLTGWFVNEINKALK